MPVFYNYFYWGCFFEKGYDQIHSNRTRSGLFIDSFLSVPCHENQRDDETM